jgi:hypothetical protein
MTPKTAMKIPPGIYRESKPSARGGKFMEFLAGMEGPWRPSNAPRLPLLTPRKT